MLKFVILLLFGLQCHTQYAIDKSGNIVSPKKSTSAYFMKGSSRSINKFVSYAYDHYIYDRLIKIDKPKISIKPSVPVKFNGPFASIPSRLSPPSVQIIELPPTTPRPQVTFVETLPQPPLIFSTIVEPPPPITVPVYTIALPHIQPILPNNFDLSNYLRFISNPYDNLWTKFKNDYNKQYAKSGEEFIRRSIFNHNNRIIDKINRETDQGSRAYRLGINRFTDLTADEFLKYRLGFLPDPEHRALKTQIRLNPDIPVPDSVDWREQGIVTPVKDQEDCASCWAFSANGAIEGQLALNTGRLVSLSEQNLIDCSKDEGNKGCEGGKMDLANDYIIRNGGVSIEDVYPYEADDAEDLKCLYSERTRGATIANYTNLAEGDEQSLKVATALVGPISVAMNVSGHLFQFYSSGIFDDPLCGNRYEDMNHAVTVVGYGTTGAGQDYWLVKNSFGVDWGEEGYVRMARNRNNMCGIATDASYPTGVR